MQQLHGSRKNDDARPGPLVGKRFSWVRNSEWVGHAWRELLNVIKGENARQSNGFCYSTEKVRKTAWILPNPLEGVNTHLLGNGPTSTVLFTLVKPSYTAWKRRHHLFPFLSRTKGRTEVITHCTRDQKRG